MIDKEGPRRLDSTDSSVVSDTDGIFQPRGPQDCARTGAIHGLERDVGLAVISQEDMRDLTHRCDYSDYSEQASMQRLVQAGRTLQRLHENGNIVELPLKACTGQRRRPIGGPGPLGFEEADSKWFHGDDNFGGEIFGVVWCAKWCVFSAPYLGWPLLSHICLVTIFCGTYVQVRGWARCKTLSSRQHIVYLPGRHGHPHIMNRWNQLHCPRQ